MECTDTPRDSSYATVASSASHPAFMQRNERLKAARTSVQINVEVKQPPFYLQSQFLLRRVARKRSMELGSFWVFGVMFWGLSFTFQVGFRIQKGLLRAYRLDGFITSRWEL